MPNCPGAKLSGAKLSWCQIVRVPNCLLLLSWCQIVRCQIVRCQIVLQSLFDLLKFLGLSTVSNDHPVLSTTLFASSTRGQIFDGTSGNWLFAQCYDFFLCAFLSLTKTFWKDIPKNLNLWLDLLISALVLCSLFEEELAEALCAPVPSSSFPEETRIFFRFLSVKVKGLFHVKTTLKNQRHCTCRWFGHWSPPPRCQRTEHSWDLFVIFSVSKLIVMFTNNHFKISSHHVNLYKRWH